MKCIWRFSIGRSQKRAKIRQNCIFGFHCVTINIEGRLNIYTSYFYSQIWLKLLGIIATFFWEQKIRKEHCPEPA